MRPAASLDLSTLNWSLRGWQPHQWRAITSMELGAPLSPVVGPIPMKVPGSVQQALRDAKLLPDWNVAANSLACEWVENRHWTLEAMLPDAWATLPGRKVLRCDGLDYRGMVVVNGEIAGAFENAHVQHAFDLTDYLRRAGNELAIVFTENPRALGQVGYTSQISEWKSRFNYGWDWVPRLVQIGVAEAIHLDIEPPDQIRQLSVYTDFDWASGSGSVTFRGHIQAAEAAALELSLEKGGRRVWTGRRSVVSGDGGCLLVGVSDSIAVDPWDCHGSGGQPLYRFSARLVASDGSVLDEATRRVGFRSIEWRPCAGAPADAEPWLCLVNGRETFLQGVNWVPLRPFYADVTDAEYRQRLEQYQALGVNVLRVWGGAQLEREAFYDLCDELGILVWQEFPFSSSSIDNWPPEDPNVIAEARKVAASYVERRQHHPSLLLWCGGNELQGSLDGGKQGVGRPIDATHPLMKAIGQVVCELDPKRRFLPASSSGPRFVADASDFGKGLHHDVHGPWNQSGSLDAWYAYWDGDDALFRSEAGFPGASSAAIIRDAARGDPLPADLTHPFWRHVSSWWIQWPDYLQEGGDPDDLEAYVAWSQARQANALGYAAAACKRRFPACGGIILWMGHDCFPCPINTSILDVKGDPKPAADAVAEVFNAPTPVST